MSGGRVQFVVNFSKYVIIIVSFTINIAIRECKLSEVVVLGR